MPTTASSKCEGFPEPPGPRRLSYTLRTILDMSGGTTYRDAERARATAWKATTPTLPEVARSAAPYVRNGRADGPPRPFCLPQELATLNLLPEARAIGLRLFGELGIPWHQGIDHGPSNHLLSSQVQCVNALAQMVTDPDLIVRSFGPHLDIDDVEEVEPGRFLTFEYIGDVDVFGEAPGRQRTRGAMCTSVDAAFLHRTHDGVRELVLVEWKYTEAYQPRERVASKDRTRWGRYGAALTAPDGPVRDDVLDFDHLLDEPLYQLVRQQLLAHELEKARAHGADRVKVVHVCPPANDAYQASLQRPAQQAVGATVSEVWSALLRRPDRFVPLDPEVFLDPEVTSAEYCARYRVDILTDPSTTDPEADSLHHRLTSDPDVDVTSLQTATDRVMSIGRDVWRLRWRGQVATAIRGTADLSTSCGAVLDALAVLEATRTDDTTTIGRPVDPTAVHVLIDRPFPTRDPSETAQALRSLRDAVVSGTSVHLWYARPEGGWVEDTEPAPTWPTGDQKITGWVSDLLIPRLTQQPHALARQIVEAVADPSLHLYPTPIRMPATPDLWALRIDGLQIGTVSPTSATLTVGRPGTSGDGTQRQVFTEVFGRPSVTVATTTSEGELTVEDAADRIRTLLRRFRGTDVTGAPVTHRINKGVPVVDEHALEARLLKGLVTLDAHGDHEVITNDRDVTRGSQFPTLWGQGTRPRYLDALLCRGSTPVAVEIKVATGGQGRYYRRSLAQAVLYRHFIRNAPDLDPWFQTAGLDRAAVEGAIALPLPDRWTPRFERDLALLRAVADHLGVAVHMVDARRTPDWTARPGQPDQDLPRAERLTWELAAALQRRWPESLGQAFETHPAGGFYDLVGLRNRGERRFSLESTRPSITMNRPGSVRILSLKGVESWVWRDAWSVLAAGADPDDVTAMLGSIAGLGPEEADDTTDHPRQLRRGARPASDQSTPREHDQGGDHGRPSGGSGPPGRDRRGRPRSSQQVVPQRWHLQHRCRPCA